MAIQFARAEYVSRNKGKNACCKGAYNARTVIKDEKTTEVEFSEIKIKNDDVEETSIIKVKYDKIVDELCLVRLHPNGENYELHPVPILTNEINQLFQQRIHDVANKH